MSRTNITINQAWSQIKAKLDKGKGSRHQLVGLDADDEEMGTDMYLISKVVRGKTYFFSDVELGTNKVFWESSHHFAIEFYTREEAASHVDLYIPESRHADVSIVTDTSVLFEQE